MQHLATLSFCQEDFQFVLLFSPLMLAAFLLPLEVTGILSQILAFRSVAFVIFAFQF